jgi:hypothetical protein
MFDIKRSFDDHSIDTENSSLDFLIIACGMFVFSFISELMIFFDILGFRS